MYQALYRKWRPTTFSQVIGQSHITDTLQRQVSEGRTAHAYLFTGTRGTGKTTCARILAKAVNCLHPVDGAPCCACEACRAIEEGTTLDITELDAASNGKVDDARALREDAVYLPTTLKRRVYIIDECHMLSKDAFNALLKILEEPPEHLLFILATTELHKVPATILSRCQRFSFKRILPRDIEKQLLSIAEAEGIPLSPDAAEILSRMANGALRDALSLLDQCRAVEGTLDGRAVLDLLGLAGSVQTVQLMRCILQRNTADTLMLFDQLYRSGKDVAALLSELSDLARDETIMKAAPDGASALLSGVYERKALLDLGQNESLQRFLYMTHTLQACCAAIPGSFHPRTDAELCLLKLCDESLSGDLTAMAQRISRLEEMIRKGVPAAPQKGTSAPSMPIKPAPRVPSASEPSYEQPPLPEEPPLPEDPYVCERVFDIPNEPAEPHPAPKAAPAAPAKAVSAGDTLLWGELLEQYKGRLPVNHRVFLNMASGVLEGNRLTVYCKDDFVKDSLNNNSVLAVLREVTSAAVNSAVQVVLTTDRAPEGSTASRPTPVKAPKPVPEKAAAESVQTPPPWEEAAPKDRLDELVKQGSQLEHFKIK